jgi:hypothetical protein
MKISAQVVLINPEGLILGVSRKDNHNDFGLIGGRMEPDDLNPEATAIRETLEETGLRISNLRLVFAIHKNGYMGYTYLADYEGEINHNEPHVVKWVPFERLVLGSFGKYNKLVAESLNDMGVEYVYPISIIQIEKEISEFVNNTPYDGVLLKFDGIRKNQDWVGNEQISVYLKHSNGESIDEELDIDEFFNEGLEKIGKSFGFERCRLTHGYYMK